MNPVIIIPVFISAARTRTEGDDILTTYDHMTPMTQPGELPRCLDSLRAIRGVGPVIVLVAGDPKLGERATKKVRQQVAHFTDMQIMVVGAAEQGLISQRMEQLGLGGMTSEIGLASYGAVRNLGLVVAQVLGYDAVVFLDDDVVVEDPDFLIKSVYGLGKMTRRGVPILAKTGYYLDEEGSYRAKDKDEWCDRNWEQGKAFNRWIEGAMHGKRLSRSNRVCGGCMTLHKEAFMRVAFDPWIARGEDLDYMLNLRMYGSDMWFDNTWWLHHLPPKTPSEGVRFRQDIFRWLYEYRKMEFSQTQIDLLQVKPDSLEPYPGPFLREGVGKRIRRTAQLRAIAHPKERKAYLQAASMAKTEATEYAESNCRRYFELQYVWPQLMDRMGEDAVLRAVLLQSVTPEEEAPEQHEFLQGFDPGATGEVNLNIAD